MMEKESKRREAEKQLEKKHKIDKKKMAQYQIVIKPEEQTDKKSTILK